MEVSRLVAVFNLDSSVSSLENVEELSTKKRADVLNAFLPKRKSLKEIKDKNIYKFGEYTVVFVICFFTASNSLPKWVV